MSCICNFVSLCKSIYFMDNRCLNIGGVMIYAPTVKFIIISTLYCMEFPDQQALHVLTLMKMLRQQLPKHKES